MVNVSRSNWEDFRKWFSAVRKHSLLFPPSLSFCPESEENEKSTYGNDSLLSIIRKTVRHDLFLFDKWTLEKRGWNDVQRKTCCLCSILGNGQQLISLLDIRDTQ